MFIQLTRTDGQPIWINAAFVVTVEPLRNGGSIVVPIGDGLDYEVREAPETVLALLKEAPPAKVVPVRPPKALTRTPEDVSPDVGFTYDCIEEKEKPKPDAPAKAPPEEKEKPAPAKRGSHAPKRGRHAKKDEPPAQADTPATPAEPAPAPTEGDAAENEEFDRIVADLKARKCRTAKRMRNAIKSFFGKTNESEIDSLLETMINKGLLLIGGDGHVTWCESTKPKP